MSYSKKFLIVPDTHGNLFYNLKHITEFILSSKNNIVVNMGDYFDSFIPDSLSTQLLIFKTFVELKLNYPEQVVLLWGNHDIQYYDKFNSNLQALCTGFQELNKWVISDEIRFAFESARDKGIDNLIQFAYFHKGNNITDSIMFSHAGITKAMLKSIGLNKHNITKSDNLEYFNQLHKQHNFAGKANQGNDSFSGTLWARPSELEADNPFFNIKQVVGHTNTSWFGYKTIVYDNKHNIVCTDCEQVSMLIV